MVLQKCSNLFLLFLFSNFLESGVSFKRTYMFVDISIYVYIYIYGNPWASPKDPTQRIVQTRRECWFYVFFFQWAWLKYIHINIPGKQVAVNFHQLPVQNSHCCPKRMLHYVFQVAWCCLLGMSSIFSTLWPVTTAKNHPSFLPTTLSDQTIVIDITLVIFTKHLMANLKGLFFSLIFWVVETQVS